MSDAIGHATSKANFPPLTLPRQTEIAPGVDSRQTTQKLLQLAESRSPEQLGLPGDERGLLIPMELNHMQLQSTGADVAAETRPDADVGGKRPANPNGPLFVRFKDI